MKRIFLSLLALAMASVLWAETHAERLRRNLVENPHYVMVVSHRGDWRNAPENSLQAFQNCIDQGVDMIEVDIHKTKDGELVCMHDKTLDRCSNGKGRISDHTLAEVKELYLKPQHAASLTRHTIPTLEEVLNLCKGNILINIDKGYDYFQDVVRLMEKTGTMEQVIIKSDKSASQVLEENGDVLQKVIYMPIVNLNKRNAREMVTENLKLKPVAIECCIEKYNSEVEELLQMIRQAGVKVWINSIWASLCDGHDDDRAVEMNEPDESWGWILERGATLIQSDRPYDLMQYLKKHKARKLK